ncbi:MAG: tRNA (adenosine(37)-N6)-threonylcarbamoyltransferase complex ATPase subunit type 1 TsaE [Treponema sp.]
MIKRDSMELELYLKTETEQATIALGAVLGTLLQKGDVIALQGPLAAGKTQLTKGIAQGLAIAEDVTSPTFTLISEHYGRLPLYHMDVYRLGSSEEFLDLGVDDLLYGDGVCVIEWSEKVLHELPKDSIIIDIVVNSDATRTIKVMNWRYDTQLLTPFKCAV